MRAFGLLGMLLGIELLGIELVEAAGIFGTSLCLILWVAALRRSAALLALLVEPESF